MKLYNKTTFDISRVITQNYSTSFSLATRLLDKKTRDAIYSIYGFVRVADDIVDTFHNYDKKYLLKKFEEDYCEAINNGISTNPVLHSFQITVKKYKIPDEHIQVFLKSMKYDLIKNNYENKEEIEKYIYGSADVVGLMCLKVFCDGDEKLYNKLENSARKLGSAFQKVNFLRDLKNDIENLGRKYFPEIDKNTFSEDIKGKVIQDIESDFKFAFDGIKNLRNKPRLAVLTAFYYYKNLLTKIKRTPANKIIEKRIRISNFKKVLLLIKAIIFHKFILPKNIN
jgi:15-cis-phytoene synthase